MTIPAPHAELIARANQLLRGPEKPTFSMVCAMVRDLTTVVDQLQVEQSEALNDPAEQRAERYAMEAVSLTERLIAAERQVEQLQREKDEWRDTAALYIAENQLSSDLIDNPHSGTLQGKRLAVGRSDHRCATGSAPMTKQQIIQRLDLIEAELFGLFKMVERLRLDLQREWNVIASEQPTKRGAP